MATTNALGLPILEPSERSPEVPWRNMAERIDARHRPVLDKDLTAPPGAPADGDQYIVGAAATGAWATHDGKIARWDASFVTWLFTTPQAGWRVWVADESAEYRYSGAAWASVEGVNAATQSALDGKVDLAGRSGGQSIFGGTGAGESISLNGSSHGTKGPVRLANEGGNVVIGTGDGNYINTSWKALTIHEATGGAVLEMASSRTDADAAIISRYAHSFTPYTNKFIADMRVVLSGTTAGNRGAAWVWLVKPDGGSAPLEGMRLEQTRTLLLGRTSGLTGVGDLDVNGAARVGSRLAVGSTSLTATARLHLAAGAAAVNSAPMKFTSGTLLTTPENGAVEFDGTNLYITISGTRRTIQVA